MEVRPSYSDNLRTDIQPSYTDSLMHHGIKGMHWGVRRFQNTDGSLTSAGKQRYSHSDTKAKGYENTAKYLNSQIKSSQSSVERAQLMTQAAKAQRKADEIRNRTDAQRAKADARFNKLADRGDKLRAKGLGPDVKNATLTKREKGVASSIVASSILFGTPALTAGEAAGLMAIDASRRHAMRASIERERYTKMAEVHKAHLERQKRDTEAFLKRRRQMDDTFRKVYGDNTELDYTKIYKEMGVDMTSEDTSVYKNAEAAWLKKHSN